MSKKVLGNKDRGLLFVISAPAGTGKTTLVHMLLDEFPNEMIESCSATTRPPRPGEVALKHYNFLALEQFKEKIEAGDFLEYANVFGNYYGTETSEVDYLLTLGKHVILVIDTQGALQIRGKMPAVFIFISPPTIEELKRRLYKRRTEDEEKIQVRLDWAQKEIEQAVHYDYHIVNDNLDVTYQILRSIFIAEEHKMRGNSRCQSKTH